MSSSQEIEEIKARINVDELLRDYLKLLPAGVGTYKAICPFHNEKTPSLMVSPQRGFWHCFGCGAGGDIFEFLMKIENISFPEALKILADRAGVVLTRQNPQVYDRKNRLYDLCELASRYWHKILLESPRAKLARDYLAQRGVSEEIIEDFNIGYAIDDWSNLFDFLIKRGFKAEEIFAAGFIIKKDSGNNYYDRFRNRIMFPIIDHNGRTCGFSGRTLNSNDPAKYINTPQTDIYNKSSIVFGLYKAKNEIRKQDAVIVVEGQMDAITCHQFGFKNTVASSGTALTKEQIQLLKRFTNNIYFALDADSAGQKASERGSDLIKAIEINSRIVNAFDQNGKPSKFIDPALSLNLNLKIISIPKGKDPDECIKNNPNDWRQAIENALPVMEYFWQTFSLNQDLNDPQIKKNIAKLLSEKIAQLDDPIEKDYWIKEISDRLVVSEEALRELVSKIIDNFRNSLKSQEIIKQFSNEKLIDDPNLLKFKMLLAIIWQFPELLSKLSQELLPEYLLGEFAQKLYKDLILFYTTNNELFSLSARERKKINIFLTFIKWLESQAVSDETKNFLEQSYLLAQKDFVSLEAREAKNEIETIIKLLKSNYLNSMISCLNKELKQAEKRNDKIALEKISISLSELIRQKSEL